MSDKPIRPEFLAKAGERELEIFLLRDAQRIAFRQMQDHHAKELAEQEREQREHREADLRQAKLDLLAERAKPELVPRGRPARTPLKGAELQAVTEHRVDASNAAERSAMVYRQREREDAFLEQQKEGRLLREAAEARERRSVPARLDLKRDFDRER